jgi:hypothetical protein
MFRLRLLLAGLVFLLCLCATAENAPPFTIPVLVVRYFPVKDGNIDISVTGDVGDPVGAIRAKTGKLTEEIAAALGEGSRWRAFRDASAKPSLKYTIVDTVEFLEPLPTVSKLFHKEPMTDYNAIMERIGIRHWVEERGVREVWIWAYHGGKVGLWESNMAGPFGDISNSNRDPRDLPVLSKTYTVYHYNYQRGASEAVEDHMHQIEALLNAVDGRDHTPRSQWSSLLFWGRFVGSDGSNRIVHPGCGWAHYPPNGEKDYDWNNPRRVLTDMDDWKPDGSGEKRLLGSEAWHGQSLNWFLHWMQHLPGPDNGLYWHGKALTNWWVFVGDFDTAMESHAALTKE